MSDTVLFESLTGAFIRVRLLSAMLECISGQGYRATTVADVVRAARTSRRSFYQEFDDKQDCFVELLRVTNQSTVEFIADHVDRDEPWQTQIRQAVTAYVTICDDRRALTLSWIRELPALGASAQSLRGAAMESWISLFVELTSNERMRSAGIMPMSRDTAILIWGGIRELTASVVESGRSLTVIIEPTVLACEALVGPRRTS